MPDTVSGTHYLMSTLKESGIWEALPQEIRREGGRSLGGFNCHLGGRNLLISLQGGRSCCWVGSSGTEFSLQGGSGAVGALARSVGSRCELHVSELASLSMASGGAHTALSLGHP